MAGLPLEANVQFLTVMATNMQFIGGIARHRRRGSVQRAHAGSIDCSSCREERNRGCSRHPFRGALSDLLDHHQNKEIGFGEDPRTGQGSVLARRRGERTRDAMSVYAALRSGPVSLAELVTPNELRN
jgi:hypothetical protein